MFDYFFVVLLQVVKLFIMIAIGYVLGKLGQLTASGTKELSGLLVNIVLPCVIISSLQVDWSADILILYAKIILATALCHGAFILIVSLLFKKEPEDARPALRFAATYGNQGYMGIPLIAAIMGNSALMAPVVAIIMFNIYAFTHGITLYGGKGTSSPLKLLKTPVIIATIAGFILMFARVRLPEFVITTMDSIGVINTPLAMIITGSQLSGSKLSELFNKADYYLAAAIKLLLMPLAAILILLPMGMERNYFIAIVILMGTPAASLTGVFAAHYNRDVATASQLVSFSTLLSIITLPLVATIANVFAK